jgi:pilus assembly protein CpaE
MGDVAAFMDLNPSQNINDLLRNIHRLDERMLSGHIVVHPSKLHVLAQPNDLVNREEVSGDSSMRILTTIANTYQHVVVDCGQGMEDAVMTATAVADHILLVATHDVPGIRNTIRRLALIEHLGIEKDRVHVVVNRWDRKNTALSLQVIEERIHHKVDVVISEDRLALKAVNEGRTLRDLDKKAQITKDIEALVGLITDGESTPEKKAGGMMDWLFGR